MIECPECNGTGAVRVLVGDEEGADRCPSCGGTGLVNEVMGEEAGSVTSLVVHRHDCECVGDNICFACAVEDDATFAVFCKQTGFDPKERAA